MDKPATKADCCSDLENESGCRNNYFDGKRLSTDSFRVEQRYHRERRHLLNRAVFGWGVVYGFPVSGKDGRLTIGPGLALDECGRELLQVKEQPVGFDDLIPLDPEKEGTCWLLSAHYAEQLTGPVKIPDSCGCEHEEFERTCETVRYSLQCVRCEKCCCKFECELQCDCPREPCCDGADTHGRGGCRCLCDDLTGLKLADDCSGPWREIEEPCGRVRVDVRHGVPLACVKVVTDAYGHKSLNADDACGLRRLVKRNDLLFDLIRGCDLTRISKIGWKGHRGEVSFEDFSAAFGPEGYKKKEYVTRDFWVEFSRPVQSKTLRLDCFAMTIMSREREGGWWQTFRVPIVRVDTGPDNPLVRRATIVVGGRWLEDAVRGTETVFHDSPTYVEIEVRGDFIVDCNGQAVDANAVGLSPGPTGNGTPGGTFISTFRVARAEGAQS
jgi:hypothetical protein